MTSHGKYKLYIKKKNKKRKWNCLRIKIKQLDLIRIQYKWALRKKIT